MSTFPCPPQFIPRWKVRALDVMRDEIPSITPEHLDGDIFTIIPFKCGVSVGYANATPRKGYVEILTTMIYCAGNEKVMEHVYNDASDFFSAMNFAYGFLAAAEKYGEDEQPLEIAKKLLEESAQYLGTPPSIISANLKTLPAGK